MNYWRTLFYAFALFPLSFCISLMSFYFHAAVVLGKFPSYGQPDPKELSFYGIYAPAVYFTGSAWMYSFVFWLLLVIVYLLRRKGPINWKPVIIGTCCQIFAVSVFVSGILMWFAD